MKYIHTIKSENYIYRGINIKQATLLSVTHLLQLKVSKAVEGVGKTIQLSRAYKTKQLGNRILKCTIGYM